MVREADAVLRKKRFLLCRYLLIVSTGAVGVIQTMTESPMATIILVVLALLSNIYLATMTPFSFFDAYTQAIILVCDTGMISAIFIVSGTGHEFFFFFFFSLIMVAYIQNLLLLTIGAVVIALASLVFSNLDEGLLSPLLMRIPFMLATVVFYGYVILPERTGEMVREGGPTPPANVTATWRE